MGDDAPSFCRDEAAWEGPKYTWCWLGGPVGMWKQKPADSVSWTTGLFLFSVLKKCYKNIVLGMGNLTLEGTHLTPWMTVMFTSSSAVVAVSFDIF